MRSLTPQQATGNALAFAVQQENALYPHRLVSFYRLIKSVLRTTLSILGERHLRCSALKNANCLRALARVLAF